jgi:hypothetical protein
MGLMAHAALAARKRFMQVGLSRNLMATLTDKLRRCISQKELRPRAVRIMARETTFVGDDLVEMFLMPGHRMAELAHLAPGPLQRELVIRLFVFMASIAGLDLQGLVPVRGLQHLGVTIGGRAVARIDRLVDQRLLHRLRVDMFPPMLCAWRFLLLRPAADGRCQQQCSDGSSKKQRSVSYGTLLIRHL